MSTDQDDFIGQVIDRYQILEKLGEGGMATVYKALDTRLGRQVAVKLIRKGQFTSDVLERVLKRFQREAQSQANLSHPNIVGLIDAGTFQGAPYLILEYLPGGSLTERLGKAYSYQEAAQILAPIARALTYAHERGVIHRDVKPSNILFTSQNTPMLSDFGIARLLKVNENTKLTGTGTGLGTPEYMSPEQWLGNASPQSDQYALAVIFYELLTAHRPYEADTPGALLLKQHNEPPVDPKRYIPNIPLKIRDILLKALERDPQNRFQDMTQFAEILEELAQGKIDTVLHGTGAAVGPTVEERAPAGKPVEKDANEITEQERNQLAEEAYTNGLSAWYARDYERAMRQFKMALGLRPGYPAVMEKLKQAEEELALANQYAEAARLFEAGEWREAIQSLNALIKTRPAYQNSVDLLARAQRNAQREELYADARRLFKAGNWEAVGKIFVELDEFEPYDPDGIRALAKVEFRKGGSARQKKDEQQEKSQAIRPPRRLFQFRGRAWFFGGLALAALVALIWLGWKEASRRDATGEQAQVIMPTGTQPAPSETQQPVIIAASETSTPEPTQTITLTRQPTVTSTPPPTTTPTETPMVIPGMVYIPGGPFQMGGDADVALAECLIFRNECPQEWRTGQLDEEPKHSVYTAAFWMDMYEVTNADYARCVAAGACTLPAYEGSVTRSSYYFNASFADYPVIYVNWFQASAFCTWAGKRLPTEAEWEKAARGGLEGKKYPWGDTFNAKLANFCDKNCPLDWALNTADDGYADTAPVGSFPANGYGLYDMAGNVWEWVSSLYMPYPYNATDGREELAASGDRIIRGGAWSYFPPDLRVADRFNVDPAIGHNWFGFRCARSYSSARP